MCDGSGKPPSESWDDVPELEGPQQDDTLKARAFAAAVAGRSGRGHWNTWEQRSWEEKRAEKSWASTVSVSSNWKEHKRLGGRYCMTGSPVVGSPMEITVVTSGRTAAKPDTASTRCPACGSAISPPRGL
eukprot:g18716.t1